MYNVLNKDGIYIEYLRKSRADLELEKLKKLDTLEQHRKLLEERTKQLGIKISKVYEEVVSGETIQDRPEMQKLLKEIETGKVDGVLVVEVERLSRGDTKDQGTVAQTFKYTNTKIITLNRIYDPNNEEDEEYFEFGLFMSRREYKTINRRMQRGRIINSLEGKYCGSTPPLGYKKIKVQFGKGNTLEPISKEADIVRQIFEKRANGIGFNVICNWLNSLDIKPRKSDVWTPATIQDIVNNPIYLGKIRWNNSKTTKTIIDGRIFKKRKKSNEEDIIFVEGLHPAIIDEELFDKANSITPKSVCTKHALETKNSLAGIIKCKKCGRNLQRRPYSYYQTVDYLLCPKAHCENIGSPLHLIEEAVIQKAQEYLSKQEKILLSYDSKKEPVEDTELTILKNELDKSKKQLDKSYELVEQGIYTPFEFTSRTKVLKEKIEGIEKKIQNKENKKDDIQLKKFIPKIKETINKYYTIKNIDDRNKLLKSIISHIDYNKTKGGRGYENNFELDIHFKI